MTTLPPTAQGLDGGFSGNPPYVVSCDLEMLWRRAGYTLPRDALKQFRAEIHRWLTGVFGQCDWIPEADLADGVCRLLAGSDLPVVSMDHSFTPAHPFLMYVSRLHAVDGKSLNRSGWWNEDHGTLEQQVETLACKVPREIALFDDVLWTGKLSSQIVTEFRRHGVTVRRIYAAVAIGQAVSKLKALGCLVEAVTAYPNVVDQLCERDFMPGAPLSGRTVLGLPDTGMPYVLPWGRPVPWASIPEHRAAEFSRLCLRLSAEIYRQMGMRLRDLPRRIHGLEGDGNTLVHELLLAAADGL